MVAIVNEKESAKLTRGASQDVPTAQFSGCLDANKNNNCA